MRTLLRASLPVAALLLAPCLAQAQLSYSLTPSHVFLDPGTTVTVSGTLTNTGSAPLYLTGAEERVVNTLGFPAGAGFTFDDTAFLTNVLFPLSGSTLAVGNSVSGALFDITNTSAPGGDYSLLFTVFGTTDPNDPMGAPLVPNPGAVPAQTIGNAQSLTVPEPGSLALCSALVSMGGLWLRSRKRRNG